MPGVPGADASVNVIIPPPEIRKIADKTAEYVAKNGSAFEEIVQKSEANNPKFSFLRQSDPYRAYFEQKVIEFARGAAPEKEVVPEPQVAVPIVQKKDIKKEIRKEVRPPPADKFTVQPPSSLTVLEMDIMRLAAQFVAKNGGGFMKALSQREEQNPQFDFLKPGHQLFPFFTKLLDAYVKCINPSQEDVNKLQQYANDKMAILNSAGERFEYDQQQQQSNKKKPDADDIEAMQTAQIEWGDFVIVETIDLFDNEELPAPSNFNKPEVRTIGADTDSARRTSLEQLTASIPAQYLPSANLQAQPTQRPAEAPLTNEVSVRRDYTARSTQADTATNKCPICQQQIPVSDFNEHLRIEMLDPSYKEVKADVQARATNQTMVSGDDIASNLQAFARNLPAVFGSVDSQGAAIRDERNSASKLIWDGQSGNMTRTTANHAMIAQQQRRNMDEQTRVIQDIDLREKKVAQPQQKPPQTKLPTVPQPTAGPQAPSKLTTHAGPQLPQNKATARPAHEKADIGGLDATKKVRTEEANLIPEEMWLLMNPENITINVKVPNLPGENIEGKKLSLSFNPKTTVGNVKAHLTSVLGGLPAARMRLTTPQQSVLKDNHTLAYYNLLNSSELDLGLN